MDCCDVTRLNSVVCHLSCSKPSFNITVILFVIWVYLNWLGFTLASSALQLSIISFYRKHLHLADAIIQSILPCNLRISFVLKQPIFFSLVWLVSYYFTKKMHILWHDVCIWNNIHGWIIHWKMCIRKIHFESMLTINVKGACKWADEQMWAVSCRFFLHHMCC